MRRTMDPSMGKEEYLEGSITISYRSLELRCKVARLAKRTREDSLPHVKVTSRKGTCCAGDKMSLHRSRGASNDGKM